MKIEKKAKLFSNIICVGDIHGEFNTFRYLIKNKYEITDSIIILCGDIGMGFHKPNYYKVEFEKLNNIAKITNNLILGVRGNHDDPAYFDGSFEFSNIKLVPDYSIIETKDDIILFIGGSLSIDRIKRIEGVSWWKNEIPIYDQEKLKDIPKPTIVVSHAAPCFAFPQSKEGIGSWLKIDSTLFDDCEKERNVFTKIFNFLEENELTPNIWAYGHYHNSFYQIHNNVIFKALNINEFYNLKN